ncbi:MAG: tetratricopeptide repeat protein [Planctomycetota bacterium]
MNRSSGKHVDRGARRARPGPPLPPEGTIRPRSSVLAWISVHLAAAVAVAYEPVRQNDFINFDDGVYIVENPHVQEGFTAEAIAWAFNVGYSGNWHPLTWFSHTLDVMLYDLDPLGHHVTNVVIHAISAVLLFLLLARMTRAVGAAAFVAGVFALHPLHVESVAWAAERKDVLSTLLGLASLHFWVDWKLLGRKPSYLLALALFVLSLTAKPMLVSLPLLLLLLDLWPLPRSKGWVALVREKLPYFALAFASSVVTYIAQDRGGAVMSSDVLSLGPRIANALVSYFLYVWKSFVPRDMSVLYPHGLGDLPAWQVVGATLFLASVTFWALHSLKRRPWVSVGWLWFVITLVPVIGIVQVGVQAMADRYTYLPMVGLTIVIAFEAREILSGLRGARTAVAAASVLALAACIVLTRNQVRLWKDDLTLFTHAVEVSENNPTAQFRLGFALAHVGRTDEALAHYNEALRLRPSYALPYNDVGMLLEDAGRIEEAIAIYRTALRYDPKLAQAHANLGSALDAAGQTEEAERELRAGLALEDEMPEAHNNLGVLLAKSNRLAEAEAALREALRQKARYVDAHMNLAKTLDLMGRREEAMAELREVLRLDPGHEVARQSLEMQGASPAPPPGN